MCQAIFLEHDFTANTLCCMTDARLFYANVAHTSRKRCHIVMTVLSLQSAVIQPSVLILQFDVSHSHNWLKKEKVLILLLFLIIWQRFSSGSSLSAGCTTEWDDIRCWPRAEVGQVANASCAEVFQHFSSNQGWFPFRAWSPNTSFFLSAPTDDHTEVASCAAQLLMCLCCVICNRNASWSQPD